MKSILKRCLLCLLILAIGLSLFSCDSKDGGQETGTESGSDTSVSETMEGDTGGTESEVEICVNHRDQNQDGKCDICQAKYTEGSSGTEQTHMLNGKKIIV